LEVNNVKGGIEDGIIGAGMHDKPPYTGCSR
jgi:hypothetical protein